MFLWPSLQSFTLGRVRDEMWIWKEYLAAPAAGDAQFIGVSAKQHRQRFIVCSPARVFKLKLSFSDARGVIKDAQTPDRDVFSVPLMHTYRCKRFRVCASTRRITADQ